MKDIKDLLTRLLEAPGVSGFEEPVREIVHELWNPLVDEISVNRLGSLYGRKYGGEHPAGMQVVLSAHMDTLGLMVSGFHGPFLRVTKLGGVDTRVLPGQRVVVHGRETVEGVIADPPADLRPEGKASNKIALRYLLVDVGASEADLRELFQVGDVITFAQQPLEHGEHILTGPGMDNRASLAALTLSLHELAGAETPANVIAVATVQEEERQKGAVTAGFDLQPDLALILDVTFARGPGTADHESYPLGGGITLGWGPSVDPDLYQRCVSLAEAGDIPWEMEPLPTRSGTDADSFQVAGSGTPTMVISIPIRYMHTPVEMVDLRDVQRAADLLTAFVMSLEQPPWGEEEKENHD